MIEVNGMAHVILTVSRFDDANAFYARLMPALGLECVFDGANMCYFVGGRTALGLQPCKPEHAGERFVSRCFGRRHRISLRHEWSFLSRSHGRWWMISPGWPARRSKGHRR